MGATASHHEPLSGADLQRQGGSQPHGTTNVFSPYGRASIRKSLRRRKSKKKKNKEEKKEGEDQVEGPSEAHVRKMDKLRRSFRDSFRKKKDSHIPESSKPHLWQSDESSVRSGTCQFYVKYLGCVEVFESRGMQVCEEALKVLRESRRRPIRGVLYVSGDGLRVVDDDTKGLIVDQTIEKVSFCAPDRNHERGFSYICRDGTTRRWMCHGFVACKESGERLSHAVGCAFAACLERKQKRDKQCGVTMTFDNNTSTFTRTGSFRQMSLTERLSDPQECKPTATTVPVKKVENPHAIERPHATPQCLQRQGSFRGFGLNQAQQFPFKRQLSLRLSELPSNLARHNNQNSPDNIIDNNSIQTVNNNGNGSFDVDNTMVNAGFNDGIIGDLMSPDNIPRNPRSRQQSLPNVDTLAPIPEASTIAQTTQPENDADAVSAMCQQVSAGLSLLSSFSDAFQSPSEHKETFQPLPFNLGDDKLPLSQQRLSPNNQTNVLRTPNLGNENNGSWNSNITSTHPSSGSERLSPMLNMNNTSNVSRGEEWLSMLNAHPIENDVFGAPSHGSLKEAIRNPSLSQLRSISLGGAPSTTQQTQFNNQYNFQPTNGRSPTSQHSGASMSSTISYPPGSINDTLVKASDPFDAEWASLDDDSKVMSPSAGIGSIPLNPNNPFLTNTMTKAFQVQM